jgi:hypothetical protein
MPVDYEHCLYAGSVSVKIENNKYLFTQFVSFFSFHLTIETGS